MRISDWSSDVCSSDLVGLAQAALDAAELGDVGVRGHEAAAGHRVAADLDDAAVGHHAFGQVRAARAHEGKAPLQRAFEVAAWRLPGQRPATEVGDRTADPQQRSEEHTSELQSLMRISYAVFCLKKKKQTQR